MNVCGRSRFFGGEAAFAGCFENAGIGIPLRLLSTTSACMGMKMKRASV